MEKTIIKKIAFLFFLTITSFTWAQGSVSNINCQNHFPMQDPIQLKILNYGGTLTNAISTSQSTTTEDDGINSYTVYITTVLIPYYATQLTGELKIVTNSFCTYNYGGSSHTAEAKLVVNNIVQSANTYSLTSGLSIGTHNYNTKAQINFVNGENYICTRKYFRIKVIKEASPTFNLSLSAYCKKNNANLYTGYIGFNVNGTATNLNPRLYFITTNTAGTCFNSTNNPRLIDISNSGNFANQFYNCSSNGTYTVYLSHRFQNIVGSEVIHDLAAGEQGWNNYTYSKTFKSCMNKVEAEDPEIKLRSLSNPTETSFDSKKVSLFPNPANDYLNLSIENEKVTSIEIYDFQKNKILELSNKNQLETLKINIQDLKSGLYFISIHTNVSDYNEKFIKS